ncbi:Short-chain dehydrogenase/reductase SDR [Paraburkholderia piptadeniae]|uniref:Peroxisomal trans-2-enoyl-CoA reductase n=1 Tax=Paraburkholderia piptadeniae TaxID=1701573 RepID=A0A1N7SF18_9BURK|nr:SDR family oxidoreductase [Paraburkholderia piptadeniae]SIT45977.1 Short-chain dehydrogenase/reductase SDR [Paraburkholderia piptadeniae]
MIHRSRGGVTSYQSIFKDALFEGQVIIVTGGGSGIGRCTAHELAALGARVVIVGRNPEKLEQVKAEIEAADGLVSSYVCDIRDDAAVIATIESVLAAHGRIDALVNNAGGQFWAHLKAIPTKGFEAVVRNNLVGGFIFMREVYNRWMEKHGGAIVNITADMWNGLPGVAHSGAARAAMHSLTESAACEWAVSGVRVNSVAPGLIASSGFDNYSGEAAETLLNYTKTIPAQRYGTVSELSAAIVFLLSPAASFITGTCIRVDGGAPNARRSWRLQEHKNSVPFEGFHLDSTPSLLKKDEAQ